MKIIEPVLCAITDKFYTEERDEQDLWMDLDRWLTPRTYQIILPLIDHPHNDIENGQKETHYHYDTRYEGNILYGKYIVDMFKGTKMRPKYDEYKLEVFELERNEEAHDMSTPVQFISKSKLKHNCIHKGKCPHRGMDLSKVLPNFNQYTEEWEITCPLHGLRFDANTKEVINPPKHETKETQKTKV